MFRAYTATETHCVSTPDSKSCKTELKLARTPLTEMFTRCPVSHGNVLGLSSFGKSFLGSKVQFLIKTKNDESKVSSNLLVRRFT